MTNPKSRPSPQDKTSTLSTTEPLISLARSADLFHTTEGEPFADVTVNGHRQTWPIGSKEFRLWLRQQYFTKTGKAPSSHALDVALAQVEAEARFDGCQRSVFTRVGELNGKIYIDLCDDKWRAIEVDGCGWRLIDCPPVRFRRRKGMQALPEPESGGSIELLRKFLNVSGETDFVLVVSWILAALRNCGPYPVLLLIGEQGTAKSTFTTILRKLIDPSIAPLRALPKEERDLFISAMNAHMLVFDNISSLPIWLSDALCRLATGGGFATRKLFKDDDEMLFNAARPMILNGIDSFVTRHDLADRTIHLMLEPIPDKCRLPETELWEAFEAARPMILGALLDAVSTGLRELPDTKLDELPRMADFALWATACETSFWPKGTFVRAYRDNQASTIEDLVEGDPMSAALLSFMDGRQEWIGTAADLLAVLDKTAFHSGRLSGSWPRSPRALSGRLRRAATFLRKVGVSVTLGEREGRNRNRIIRIVREVPAGQNFASAPSAQASQSTEEAQFAGVKVRTQNPNGDANLIDPSLPLDQFTSGESSVKLDADDADGADAKSATAESDLNVVQP